MIFQQNLDIEMLETAKVKDRELRSKAIQKENESITKPVRRLMRGTMALFSEKLEQWIDAAPKKAGFKHTAWPFLAQFTPDLVAYVSSKVIFNSISIQKPVTSLCMKIGQALESELHFKLYEKEHPVRACVNKKSILKRVSQAFKRKGAYAYIRASKTKIQYLSPTERLHIGSVCLNLFIESTGLVKIYKKWESPKKSVNMIRATDECVEWIKQYSESDYIVPRYLPCVNKPKPWTTENFMAGGYDDSRLAYPLVKLRSPSLLESIKTSEMPLVYDSMNRLQETPWKINKWIFNIMEEFWAKGLDDGSGIPVNKVLPLPSKPKEGASVEEIRAYSKKAAFVHSRNVELSSQRVALAQIIHTAKRYLSVPKFYFPVQADFRGRVYYVPGHLNPQGTDYAKALLEFSEGEQLTSDGLKWLMMYGSGLFGLDKESFQSRLNWVSKNGHNIRKCVELPWHYRWWTEAKEPWQFLRWCKEYVDATTTGGFVSCLPITLDCTASGLQILSLLGHDEQTAGFVNLVEAEEPKDIYKIVLGVVLDLLHKEKGDWANFWLKAKLDRSAMKQPVMAMPYGISLNGIRNGIEQWYYKTYGMDKIDLKDFWGYSMSLSRLIVRAMAEAMPKVMECMKHMESLAKEGTKGKEFKLSWVSPSGFRVVQPYMKTNSKMVKTSLHGNFVYPVLREEDARKINRKKQISSFSPNFIHSLDASLVHFLAKDFDKIVAVHDCFGTHGNHIPKMIETLKNSMVTIFTQNILDSLKVNEGISATNTFTHGNFCVGQLQGAQYIVV